MANHVMTPARRAALRKAQLISAQKRRRYGVGTAIVHTTRQRVGIAYREGQLKHYRNSENRQLAGQKVKALPGKAGKAGAKYVVKRTAIGAAKAGLTIGAATAVGYTAYGMTSGGKIHRANRAQAKHLGSMGYGRTTHVKSTRIHPVFGAPIKSLPVGPKGRATTRQRMYRAKKRTIRARSF